MPANRMATKARPTMAKIASRTAQATHRAQGAGRRRYVAENSSARSASHRGQRGPKPSGRWPHRGQVMVMSAVVGEAGSGLAEVGWGWPMGCEVMEAV